MSIEIITESAWPEILKLQSEVYLLVEPESLEVLQDKWNRTPKCCFIFRDKEELKGYLLAHSWNKELPPKLFNTLPKETEGDILFLHDLAVASSSFWTRYWLKTDEASGWDCNWFGFQRN